MDDLNRTTEIKICSACSADLPEAGKYCRRCGVKQPAASEIPASGVTTGAITVISITASNPMNYLPVAPTSALSEVAPTSALSESEENTYHKVSGPLVEAVAVRMAARAFSKFQGQFVRQLLSALISIPIWLIIILLSPFDAYFAAKHISSQVALK